MKEQVECIHFEAPAGEVPTHIIRGDIFSLLDPICDFCGGVCNGSKKIIPSIHVIGNGFIYCPERKKAYRVPEIAINQLSDQCSPEHGCGGIMYASKVLA